MVEHSAVKRMEVHASCSFRGKPRLKNQVNSGKPRPESQGNPEPSSEAGTVQRRCRDYPAREYFPRCWGQEAPESVIRAGGSDMI